MLSLLKDKHILIAMLIAPILAVITWFAVGKFAGPKPFVAEAGQSYPLIAKPNCRYQSGHCTLVNNEFRVNIRPYTEGSDNAVWLGIDSPHPIDGARLSLLDDQGKTFVIANASEFDAEGRRGILLPPKNQNIETLRIALSSANVIYYAETQTQFLSHVDNSL